MDLNQRAKEYFKNHFSIHTFHFTADGMAFHRKSDAEAHARTLTNKDVKTILRADVEIAEENVADGQPDAHEGTEDTKVAPEENATKIKATSKKATAAAK